MYTIKKIGIIGLVVLELLLIISFVFCVIFTIKYIKSISVVQNNHIYAIEDFLSKNFPEQVIKYNQSIPVSK